MMDGAMEKLVPAGNKQIEPKDFPHLLKLAENMERNDRGW